MNGKYEKEIQWSLVIKNTDITILIITKNCRIEASEFFTRLEKCCMVPNQTVKICSDQGVIWTKILTSQQVRLLIKVTRSVLLGQQTLPWRAITITITGQVTKNVASPAQNEPVIGLEDRLLLTRWQWRHMHSCSGIKFAGYWLVPYRKKFCNYLSCTQRTWPFILIWTFKLILWKRLTIRELLIHIMNSEL